MNLFCVLLIVNVLVQIDLTTMLQAKVMLNRNEQGHKESEIFNSLKFKNYRVTNVLSFCMFPWGEHIGEVACRNYIVDYDA